MNPSPVLPKSTLEIPASFYIAYPANDARLHAIEYHESANNLYDKHLPYVYHLDCVYGNADRFRHLVPDKWFNVIRSACYHHDSIEDARIHYDTIRRLFGDDVAEIVYALTNDKGRNRKERESDKYFEGIKNTMYATFVKLCDRIANVEYSKRTSWKPESKYKLQMYANEYARFKDHLYDEKYKEMFDYLETLFEFATKAPSSPSRNEPYIDWNIPSKDAGADGSLRAGYLTDDLIEALNFIEMITRAPIVKESDKELKTQAEKFLTKYLPK